VAYNVGIPEEICMRMWDMSTKQKQHPSKQATFTAHRTRD
jgi:hypothetical protein